MLVIGEVRRDPVDDHTDVILMKRIDKIHELIRIPEPAGGGIITRCLVTPGSGIRVLGHRHQFHVGVPHFLHIGGELFGKLDIG